MIQHCLHNNCGSLSLALIMRLLSSSAIACRLGFTRSCLPAPPAQHRARAKGLRAWPGLPSLAPGTEQGSRRVTAEEGRRRGLVLVAQLLKDPGGGLEHCGGLEHLSGAAFKCVLGDFSAQCSPSY